MTMPYMFNVRTVVRVQPGVPKELTPYINRRGIILYHAKYEHNEPTHEAVLIGVQLLDARRYKNSGQIKETAGGSIHVIPVQFLKKTRTSGKELAGEGVLI
jgi:hypothetical protein